jgi:hypothetical protein
MANALTEVQDTFTNLDAKYNMLRAACKTDMQRSDLAAQYSRAMAAYQECVNKFLSDDDLAIAALGAELKTANDNVANAVKEMGNMNHVIDEVTEAVDIGAKIVGFAFPDLKL